MVATKETQPLGRVLLVEDQREIRLLVGRWLEASGYEVRGCESAEEAIQALSAGAPDVVCLDLQLPGMQGLDALRVIRARHPALPVVMLTAAREVETVVAAMQLGAFDYLTKPMEQDKLVTTVGKAISRHRGADPSARQRGDGVGTARLLGQSAPMRSLVLQLEQVAAKDITVLIHGESGTGKELVARALHEQSPRSGGPFVALNCAAVPESLQESEFFGHEKGSFTGATGQRKGRFELADGGTLFLDEVAELSLPLQAKLLRVLQERRFQRVGGTTELSSDFRLITATHRDLAAEAHAGKFREDLYFRIAVFELEVPPLRTRGDDVLLLARTFSKELAGGRVIAIDAEAESALLGYGWPGNVRELQNAIQRALVVARDDTLRIEDLPARLVAPQERRPGSSPGEEAGPQPMMNIEELERKALEDALVRTHGNVTEVVRQLGIGRTTVYRKMKKFGLR